MHRIRKRNRRSSKDIELLSVSLDVRSVVNPTWGSDLEPDAPIVNVQGDITAYPDPDSDDMKIGTIRAYVVHFDQADEAGFEWFDVLDSATEDIAKYLALIDPKESEFTHSIESTFDVHARHLLILDRIRIEPQYRGHGYSLYAAHSMINSFGVSGGVAACLPAPYELIETREERIRRTGQDETGPIPGWDAAQEQLRKHWSFLGFRQIPGSDVFALSLSFERPSIKQVIEAYYDSKSARQSLDGRNGREQFSLIENRPLRLLLYSA